jgi:7-carboxy-7-deazaguanine synthase
VTLTVQSAVRRTGHLLVSELFGPTFQGEGPSAGQRAAFLRLAGCNLACTWCDSRHSWDWRRYDKEAETRHVPIETVATELLAMDTDLVVITGGEPLLQTEAITHLARTLRAAGRSVEVETNGTIPPPPQLSDLVERFNVSPKLRNAGLGSRPIDTSALAAFAAGGKAVFKFVVCSPDDAAQIAALQDALALRPVWVMPQAITPEQVLSGMRQLAEIALEHGWNLTSRLHILLWGDQRGR